MLLYSAQVSWGRFLIGRMLGAMLKNLRMSTQFWQASRPLLLGTERLEKLKSEYVRTATFAANKRTDAVTEAGKWVTRKTLSAGAKRKGTKGR